MLFNLKQRQTTKIKHATGNAIYTYDHNTNVNSRGGGTKRSSSWLQFLGFDF